MNRLNEKIAEILRQHPEGEPFFDALDAVWQLFGHVHSNSRSKESLDQKRLINCFPTQYDVGVDNNNFTLISFDEVSKIIANQQLLSEIHDKK